MKHFYCLIKKTWWINIDLNQLKLKQKQVEKNLLIMKQLQQRRNQKSNHENSDNLDDDEEDHLELDQRKRNINNSNVSKIVNDNDDVEGLQVVYKDDPNYESVGSGDLKDTI